MEQIEIEWIESKIDQTWLLLDPITEEIEVDHDYRRERNYRNFEEYYPRVNCFYTIDDVDSFDFVNKEGGLFVF